MLQGAEPFFFPNGRPVGCLLVHGFMSSPAELRWMGLALAERGLTVYAPRLAGHGTDYHDIARARWQDWYADVLDGYHLLRGQCERVFIVGHSLGGLLALMAAAELPLDGAAILAAPFTFRSWLLPYARWLKWLRPYTHQPDASDLPQRVCEEQARRGEPVLGRVRYDNWSTAALAEFYALVQKTRASLPAISAPLLLIYSQPDSTAPPANADLIAAEVASTTIERHILSDCGHNLPLDSQRETVYELVANFTRNTH